MYLQYFFPFNFTATLQFVAIGLSGVALVLITMAFMARIARRIRAMIHFRYARHRNPGDENGYEEDGYGEMEGVQANLPRVFGNRGIDNVFYADDARGGSLAAAADVETGL